MYKQAIGTYKAFMRETDELTDTELNNLIEAYADFLCTSSRHESTAELNQLVMDTLNLLVGELKRRQVMQ